MANWEFTAKNNPKYIILHVTGSKDLTDGYHEINEFHKSRFPYTCELVDGVQKKVHLGYHDLILRDGTIVNCKDYSHAGQQAKYLNTQSIGISCVASGKGAKIRNNIFYDSQGGIEQILSSGQIESMNKLVRELMTIYNIPVENILSHHDLYVQTANKYIRKKYLQKYGGKMLKTCPSFSAARYSATCLLDIDYMNAIGEDAYKKWERPYAG